MFSPIPTHLPLSLRSTRVFIVLGVAAAAAVGISSYIFTRRKPTAEEMERERRELLAKVGRITDGTISDTVIAEKRGDETTPDEETAPVMDGAPTPRMIVYKYRIAGVTYECAQDVTTLAELVHGIRTHLPIQVRYAPQNPVNSIVVAETWSGLQLGSQYEETGSSGSAQ